MNNNVHINIHDFTKEVLKIVRIVKDLTKNPEVKALVDSRLKEFRKNRYKPADDVFKELCFCILTANFDASKTIRIQEEVKDGFSILNEEQLSKTLKNLGHRFPNARADYIIRARRYKTMIKNMLLHKNEHQIREWLVNNIKGVGYKEASHFLRNLGFNDVAIIDFHILDLLEDHALITKPKTLTKRRYLYIEESLRMIAKKLDIGLGELDLYLWYHETGKILK